VTNPTWDDVRQWISKSVTVDGETACWLWTKPVLPSGYGRIWGEMAHRLSYQAHVGPIGKGLDIDHLCRNRACVNPAHLEPVTRRENLSRGIGIDLQKEAAAERTHCERGHPVTPENIYVRPSDGIRTCRICKKMTNDARRKEKKDEINARKREWRKKWREQGVRK
jgi:hypothetical protein